MPCVKKLEEGGEGEDESARILFYFEKKGRQTKREMVFTHLVTNRTSRTSAVRKEMDAIGPSAGRGEKKRRGGKVRLRRTPLPVFARCTRGEKDRMLAPAIQE